MYPLNVNIFKAEMQERLLRKYPYVTNKLYYTLPKKSCKQPQNSFHLL